VTTGTHIEVSLEQIQNELECGTHDILMRVHKYIKTIIPGNPEHANGMLDPFLVIDARTGSLDGLPGEDIADCVVTVAF
jgi:hypothetical protein